jgi:flagellar hook-associated protein 2
MSMSVDGLISGMDTTSLITQLLQAEAGPQTALKKRLTVAETSASAYRTVNTAFAAVRSAAEAVLKSDTWTPMKATSSASSVAVSASNGAQPGSLTFTVDELATSHSVLNRTTPGTWTSATSAYGAAEIEVFDENGVALTPKITIGGTGTLADAAAAINADTTHKLSASVVQLSTGEAALRITSEETGAASKFSLAGAGSFTDNTVGRDAKISIGVDNPVSVTSATNTFDSVLPGATLTVSQKGTEKITVSIADDPNAVAAKVQSLVDAVNSALTTVKTYTNNSKGSTAALRGDFSVNQLAGQLLDAVSFAVGPDGSPAKVGFELSKDGKVSFDKNVFLNALKEDPALAQRMAGGTAAGIGPDAIAGTGDDVAASGVAGRLLQVAKSASDSTTGALSKLAQGQDSLAEDIQDKIEAWDIRLAKRKEMLTRQFTAMETALSGLKNQSTWLAGQINGLPQWS